MEGRFRVPEVPQQPILPQTGRVIPSCVRTHTLVTVALHPDMHVPGMVIQATQGTLEPGQDGPNRLSIACALYAVATAVDNSRTQARIVQAWTLDGRWLRALAALVWLTSHPRSVGPLYIMANRLGLARNSIELLATFWRRQSRLQAILDDRDALDPPMARFPDNAVAVLRRVGDPLVLRRRGSGTPAPVDLVPAALRPPEVFADLSPAIVARVCMMANATGVWDTIPVDGPNGVHLDVPDPFLPEVLCRGHTIGDDTSELTRQQRLQEALLDVGCAEWNLQNTNWNLVEDRATNAMYAHLHSLISTPRHQEVPRWYTVSHANLQRAEDAIMVTLNEGRQQWRRDNHWSVSPQWWQMISNMIWYSAFPYWRSGLQRRLADDGINVDSLLLLSDMWDGMRSDPLGDGPHPTLTYTSTTMQTADNAWRLLIRYLDRLRANPAAVMLQPEAGDVVPFEMLDPLVVCIFLWHADTITGRASALPSWFTSTDFPDPYVATEYGIRNLSEHWTPVGLFDGSSRRAPRASPPGVDGEVQALSLIHI